VWYRLAEREHRLRVPAESPLDGKTGGELDLRSTSGASIVAIERSRRFDREVIVPTESTELHAGDVLLVDLFRPDVSVEALRERYALEVLPLRGEYFADRSQEIGMAEVKLTATSELAVKTIVESKFRTRFGLTMIGLRH
jgi:uncharacterized protein with PhoU and TrkA domain